MTNHPNRSQSVEFHIPTTTSRDTLIEIRARSRVKLESGVFAAVQREMAKGEIVTPGSSKVPFTKDYLSHEVSALPIVTNQSRLYVATIRIRRDAI